MDVTLLHAATAFYLLSIAASFGRFTFPAWGQTVKVFSVALAWTGAGAHLVSIGIRGLVWGGFSASDATDVFSLLALLVVMLALALPPLLHLPWMSMFLLPAAMMLLLAEPFTAVSAPSVAAERGILFFVHMGLVGIAATALFGHVVASSLYMAQETRLKAKRVFLAAWGALPSLDACDRAGLRSLGAGFAALSLGILTGALEAMRVRGHFFAWKFPEIFALLTWLLFGSLLEARLARGWRGRMPAALSIAGFLLLLAVFVGVSLP